MKPATLIGIVLIIAGLAVLALGGFTFTKKEKLIEFGPVKVVGEKKEAFPIPPIVGYAALGAGVLLVAAGAFAGRK